MKTKSKHLLALLLTGALLTGLLPVGTGTESQAAEQPALKNPRIIKTVEEVAPEAGSRKQPKNPTAEKGITTWDCIWFGNYWQEDTNGDGKVDKNDKKTPIKWRVLSVEGDDAFLMADKNLDCQRYNDTDTDVTWETCTMRSWLNGYGAESNKDGKDYSGNNFLDNAFSADEQSAIRTTNVVNHDNPEYGTEGGNDTMDKVYLLSLDEVENPSYGFGSHNSTSATRVAVNTAYTAGGGEVDGCMSSAGKAGAWWLRSSGYDSDYASCVDDDGFVCADGYYVDNSDDGVRPALHLNLKASSDAVSVSGWSYAGTVPSDDVAEWDCIWFGNYWQEDTNGDGKADKNDKKTPIKWRVLSVDGDDVFLMADKNLDCQRYNDTYTDVTWETCTMRSWLNGYGAESNRDGKDYSGNNFLNNAFSVEEQSAIKTTNVVNHDNPEYGTEGGNDTTDKVYLLSLDEVKNLSYGFGSHNSTSATRVAVNTAYTAGGGEIESEYMSSAGKVDYWWLRSSGIISFYASCVDYNGYVSADGGIVGSIDSYGVRPALHLNLKASSDAVSASSWSYAGSVTSNEEESETATPTPDGTATPTPDVTATPTPDGTATPTPDVTATPTPDGTATPTPDVTATPTPDGTATPTPDVTATPTPDSTATPTPDVTATPTPDSTATPTEPSNNTTQTAKPTEETNKHNSLSKGTVLKDKKNEVSYRVLAQDRVEFYKADNKETTKITIPSVVSMDGVKFKVTDISDNAFNGCKKLKSVTIGKSVTTIGNKAFSKCTSLKKITIPAGVTKIGKKAFYGCKKLKSITIKTKKLKNKSVGAQAFKGLHKKAVIKVPKKQKKAYTKWLRKKGITKKMKIK